MKKGDGKKLPCKRVSHIMVDFHNVLEINERIPLEHSRSMEELLSKFKVAVCSFCGPKRAEDVRKLISGMPWFPKLHKFFTVTKRHGPGSKGSWCEKLGCQVLMDDSGDILQDALEKGVRIMPITTKRDNHIWFSHQGIPVYPSFWAAAKAICKEAEIDPNDL